MTGEESSLVKYLRSQYEAISQRTFPRRNFECRNRDQDHTRGGFSTIRPLSLVPRHLAFANRQRPKYLIMFSSRPGKGVK